jgi:hypothetical protein
MRVARVSAAIILTSFFLLALKESRYAGPAFGQTAPAAGPSVPSITLPAAPGQPQAFSTIGALPQLLPAPGPALSSPTPTPGMLTFRCACNGPGSATSWMGPVSAANLVLAEMQQAPAACLSYKVAANAESPLISQPGSVLSSITQPVAAAPGTLYSAPPGSNPVTVQVPPPVLNHQSLASIRKLVLASQCQRCSCD